MCLRPDSHAGSYEDLRERDVVEMLPTLPHQESDPLRGSLRGSVRGSVRDPLRDPLSRRARLVRQASTMETPLDSTGGIKMTHWF